MSRWWTGTVLENCNPLSNFLFKVKHPPQWGVKSETSEYDIRLNPWQVRNTPAVKKTQAAAKKKKKTPAANPPWRKGSRSSTRVRGR